MQPVSCTNCGAPMAPSHDGRTYGCNYCGARVQVAVAAEQIAAGLALDLHDMEAFLAQLANTMSQGLAEQTKIQARGRTVDAIEIDLDPDIFIARRSGAHVVSEHKRIVRGIVLKTNSLPLDHWVERLTDALARHANTNARAAWVLGRIKGSA